MNHTKRLRRAAGLLALMMMTAMLTACGGAGETKTAEAYATLDEAVTQNAPADAAREQTIEVRDGKTVVLYSRADDAKPFVVQAYGESADGWRLLSGRTPLPDGAENAVQELFPAQDNLIAFCVSPDAADDVQQAYEFHIEAENGWVFGYNPVTPLE